MSCKQAVFVLRHEIGIRKTLQSIVSLVSFFLFVFYMVQLDDPPLNIVEILNMTLHVRLVLENC